MKAMAEQVAKKIESEYYDPAMRGLNWKALLADAKQKIDAANEPGAMLVAVSGMVEKLKDSHTVFLPPRRTKTAYYGFDIKMYGDEPRISKVKKDSPAQKAGLQPGDRVLKFNGYAVTRETLLPLMMFFRVLSPTTASELVLARGDGAPETLRINADIRVAPEYRDVSEPTYLIQEMIREAETNARENPFLYSEKDDIGYLALPTFEASPTIMKELASKISHSKVVIVDLRDNPGGDLRSLVAMAGMFQQGAGVLGKFVGRKKTEELRVKPLGPKLAAPLVILVDSDTGSAAEIFARYFQQQGRAIVIGDQTSGSVMVAQMFPGQVGTDLSAVLFAEEISVGRMVMANDEELEHKGVTPDRKCIPAAQEMRAGKDVCLAMAYEAARERAGIKAATANSGK